MGPFVTAKSFLRLQDKSTLIACVSTQIGMTFHVCLQETLSGKRLVANRTVVAFVDFRMFPFVIDPFGQRWYACATLFTHACFLSDHLMLGGKVTLTIGHDKITFEAVKQQVSRGFVNFPLSPHLCCVNMGSIMLSIVVFGIHFLRAMLTLVDDSTRHDRLTMLFMFPVHKKRKTKAKGLILICLQYSKLELRLNLKPKNQ